VLVLAIVKRISLKWHVFKCGEQIVNTAEELNPDIKAIYLAAEDLKVAASILFQAYHDDPLFMDIFQAQKPDYDSRLRAAIREELHAFWQAHEPMVGLFDGERLIAVVALIAPDTGFGPGRFWNWRLRMLLTAGFFCTNKMIEKEEKVQAAIPANKYHMISFIGVHPDEQHHGLGHMLMEVIDSILAEHETSEGVSVFATLPKTMEFFEHGHYERVKSLEVGHITGEVMFRRK
jgi:ribosomal protein S18 acetylase RimI-like enzyme